MLAKSWVVGVVNCWIMSEILNSMPFSAFPDAVFRWQVVFLVISGAALGPVTCITIFRWPFLSHGPSFSFASFPLLVQSKFGCYGNQTAVINSALLFGDWGWRFPSPLRLALRLDSLISVPCIFLPILTIYYSYWSYSVNIMRFALYPREHIVQQCSTRIPCKLVIPSRFI